MADYTVLVDDSNTQIIYGPEGDFWTPFDDNTAYQETVHLASFGHANLTLSFLGGREAVIRGNFVGDNNATDRATYPIFQVDSQIFLNCDPNPPQNGGQFLCVASLPATITNRTLTMFVDPNVAIQQFRIDYFRHGSSSRAVQATDGAVLFVQSPDNSTPGLSFEGNWQTVKSLGDADIIESATLQTSAQSSKATYHFVGDSFAWWGCCMPPDTSINAANATYTIDGGVATSIQIGEQFLQGAQCKNERILFQTRPGQLQVGNHTVEVVYNRDDTKAPLTLCALAATPLDFNALDVLPSSSRLPLPSSTIPSHDATSHLPSITLTATGQDEGTNHSSAGSHQINTLMVAGIISCVVMAFIMICVSTIWWRKKRAKRDAQEKRSSSTDSLLPFAFHPVFGIIDMDKRASAPIASLPALTPTPSDIPTALPGKQ